MVSAEISDVAANADRFDESFEVWFAPVIARETLQAAMRRTNAHALRAFGL